MDEQTDSSVSVKCGTIFVWAASGGVASFEFSRAAAAAAAVQSNGSSSSSSSSYRLFLCAQVHGSSEFFLVSWWWCQCKTQPYTYYIQLIHLSIMIKLALRPRCVFISLFGWLAGWLASNSLRPLQLSTGRQQQQQGKKRKKSACCLVLSI